MPAWEMHIAIANRVNKILKMDDELFIIGNVIPDAEGYVIENPSVKVPYAISHYAEHNIEGVREVLPRYQRFIGKYKEQMNNPVVMGYFVHILTDFYWNRMTFKNYYTKNHEGETVGIRLNTGEELICSKDERRILKQTDFMFFSNYLINNNKLSIPKLDKNKIKESIKIIEEIPLSDEDIEKTINHLNNMINKRENKEEYKVFTKEKFEEEFENCIKFILKEIENL